MSGGASSAWRRSAPALAVVGVILLLTIGGRVAATLAGEAAAPNVGVDGVAVVHPPAGWSENVEARASDGSSERTVIAKGNAAVVVTAIPDARTAAPTLAEVYLGDVLGDRFLRYATTRPVPAVVGGLPGVRVTYVGETLQGAAVEGVVTVAVSPDGAGLVLDGFAPEGFLAAIASDLRDMAEGAEIG